MYHLDCEGAFLNARHFMISIEFHVGNHNPFMKQCFRVPNHDIRLGNEGLPPIGMLRANIHDFRLGVRPWKQQIICET